MKTTILILSLISFIHAAIELELAKPHFPTIESHVEYLKALSHSDELRFVDSIITEKSTAIILQSSLGLIWIDQQDNSNQMEEVYRAISLVQYRVYFDDKNMAEPVEYTVIPQDERIKARTYSIRQAPSDSGEIDTFRSSSIWNDSALRVFKIPSNVKKIRIAAIHKGHSELDWERVFPVNLVRHGLIPLFKTVQQFGAFCQVYVEGCEVLGQFEAKGLWISVLYNKSESKLTLCRLPQATQVTSDLLLSITPKGGKAIQIELDKTHHDNDVEISFLHLAGVQPRNQTLNLGYTIDLDLPSGSEIKLIDLATGSTIVSELTK
jgi:hypothetical protein